MKACVPTIGTYLRLTENWIFPLHQEYRNQDLVRSLGLKVTYGRYVSGNWIQPDPEMICLKAGTLLSVTRIYIRGSFRDYDSFTFRLLESPDPVFAAGKATNNQWGTTVVKGVKFWAKLADVNHMEFEFEDGPPKKTRKV